MGLLWGLQPKEPYVAGDTSYEEENPRYHPGGSGCYPPNIARLPYRERLGQGERCDEAREQHRLSTNDLIQQRRAANAGEAMTVLSYSQTRIALWGLIFGVLTLTAAGLAAFYAGMAAGATKEAADAAWKAVAVTEDMGQRQVRAYVNFTQLEIRDFAVGHVPQIIHELQNFGASPAYRVKIMLTVSLVPDPHRGGVRFNKQGIYGHIDIGPGIPNLASFRFREALSEIMFRTTNTELTYIVVGGYASYTDAFNRRRRTIIRAYVRPSDIKNGCAGLRTASRNNRSN